MRKPFIYIVLIFLYLFTANNTHAQCYGNLVWSDEFNGPNLDLTKWSYDIGDGCPSLCGWGNNELEYYTNSTNNVYISGGVLHLEAIRENYGGREFTSGKIHTRTKFDHTYGRVEARIRMPQGDGLWPAFWMLRHDNTWPMTGEIDIMEYRGDITNRTSGTLHYGSAWPNNQWDGDDHDHSTDLYTDFHIYAVEWDTNYIKWYFDDVIFKIETRTPNSLNPASTDDPWPWDEDFWIILNHAVGGWFPGVTDPANVNIIKPDLEVDYVRVYDMRPAITDQTPYNGVIPIPGRVEIEEFDVGCPGIAYSDGEEFNLGGVFRYEEVDIEATTDVGGGYNIGWTAADEWLEYTVNVAASGTYDIDFRVASNGGGGAIRVEMNGANVTGTVNVPNTGGWQNWQTVSLTGVPLNAGQQVMRIYIEIAGLNFNYIDFTGNSLPVTWLAFNAQQNGNAVHLDWQTTSEYQNDYFDIEHSTDGSVFQVIGTVPGIGTGNGIYNYNYTDLNPAEGINYYRLAQYDTNGSVSYSTIESVNFVTLGIGSMTILDKVKIYPNPTEDQLIIDCSLLNGETQLSMYSMQGNVLIENKTAVQLTLWDISQLSAGVYVLEIIHAGYKRRVKIIKK